MKGKIILVAVMFFVLSLIVSLNIMPREGLTGFFVADKDDQIASDKSDIGPRDDSKGEKDGDGIGTGKDEPETGEVYAAGGGADSASPEGKSQTGAGVEETYVFLLPPYSINEAGEGFKIRVEIISDLPVFAAQFELHFDADVLEVIGLEEGGFLDRDGASTYFVKKIDNYEGKVIFGNTRFGTEVGVPGSGTLGIVEFMSESEGKTSIELKNVLVTDSGIKEIPSSTDGGIVYVS